MTPNWLGLVLLGLAAYRTWRLIAEDTITEPVRQRLVRREYVSELVSCPWCLGSWIAAVWWACWYLWPHTTSAVAAPFAIAALVGLVASVVGALED